MSRTWPLAVLLYEIFLATGKDRAGERIKLIDNVDKKVLEETLGKAFDEMVFSTEEKRDTQEILWKRVLGKAMLTKREFNAVMGFLKKITERRLKEK